MKRILFSALSVLVVGASLAGLSSAQTDAAPAPKKLVESGTLSDEAVAALKESYTDTKLKTSWQWTGEFSLIPLNEKEKKLARANKKIPYRLTAALYEIKDVNGRMTPKRLPGTAWFYLMDEAGKIIHKRSQNLDKMCPS